MNTGLYAGSFDPPTRGHMWMIEQALILCDTLYIGVGTNPNKTPMFTVEERIAMLRKCTWWLDAERVEDGTVDFVALRNKYTVQEAIDRDCNILIRGIRSGIDVDGEWAQRVVNDDIAASYAIGTATPLTVFLMPPPKLTVVSSSMVKSLIGFPHWQIQVEKYVNAPVLKMLEKKFPSE